MDTEEGSEETTVSDRGIVTIPADRCRRLDIESEGKLRWTTAQDGALSVEVVRQREGVFDDFDVADGISRLETAENPLS